MLSLNNFINFILVISSYEVTREYTRDIKIQTFRIKIGTIQVELFWCKLTSSAAWKSQYSSQSILGTSLSKYTRDMCIPSYAPIVSAYTICYVSNCWYSSYLVFMRFRARLWTFLDKRHEFQDDLNVSQAGMYK